MSPQPGAAIVRGSAGSAAPDAPDLAAHPALKAFSVERMMGYGVHHADAVALRARVAVGRHWRAAAGELADTCLSPSELAVAPASPATRANRLYRASALLRLSQVLMLSDDEDRRRIFARAADLFEQAARLGGECERVRIATRHGPLAGWFYPAVGESVGCAVVIGGIEAWAMDFSAQGYELARRGVDALVLDGPGHGESRLAHGHYLTRDWAEVYRDAFDHLLERTAGLPLAMVGNSMGGVVAMRLAAQDPRIAACCGNGAPRGGGGGAPNPMFVKKVAAHCGEVDPAEASAIWSTVRPGPGDARLECPLLIVHGGLDPGVSADAAQGWLDAAASADKRIVTYADGDHCVYNHAQDVRNLIADWVADRLKAPAP